VVELSGVSGRSGNLRGILRIILRMARVYMWEYTSTMPQLAIYLDEQTARLLDRAARREGISRSAWVRSVVRSRVTDRLPDAFFAVLGRWEDGRSSEEILRDIRGGTRQRRHERLR
jgi:ribbon-helix-helix CopG family protein